MSVFCRRRGPASDLRRRRHAGGGVAGNSIIHERLDRPEEANASSNRGFGLTFAAVGAIVAVWPLLAGEAPRWWWLAGAAGFCAVSLAAPHLLNPLNRAWQWIGRRLNGVASPIVLGLVFYVILAPLGIALRLSGRDPLRLRFDKDAASYWLSRDPPGPGPGTMTRQF